VEERGIFMDRIRKLLEEKRFLETNDKALKMDSIEWEERYMSVMQQIQREERRSHLSGDR